MSPPQTRRSPGYEPRATTTSDLQADQASSISVPVTGRIVLHLGRFVDDVGFVGDAARSVMAWPEVPDGIALLVDIGDAWAWNTWLFDSIIEGPRWSRIEVRGTGDVGRAVREIRAAIGGVR